MTTAAEIRLWGTTVGAVFLEEGEDVAAFEYSGDFARSGIELAPLTMPLSRRVYRFPALPRATFHGLPGLLADSLPDRFGNALIDAWLAREGRLSESFSAVERLCYTGRRGMGALEYAPALGPRDRTSKPLDLDRLVDLASELLSRREGFRAALGGETPEEDLRSILQVGTSAGGARAKAVIAWNPRTSEVRSGQVEAPAGFEHWLLKFDGVTGNRDREFVDGAGYGEVEYAYHLMAAAAGIGMSECRLLEEHTRRHFMTRRFDRTAEGGKLHMLSLGALAHYDFNAPGAHGYEQAFAAARALGLGVEGVEELYRRMVFNLLARNQDDHVKNIAFLMDRRGRWSLAPAYDLIYSYNPDGLWTGSHQMTVNGLRDGFARADLKAAASAAGMVRGRWERMLDQVGAAALRWMDFAAEAGVPEARAAAIKENFRLYLLSKN